MPRKLHATKRTRKSRKRIGRKKRRRDARLGKNNDRSP